MSIEVIEKKRPRVIRSSFNFARAMYVEAHPESLEAIAERLELLRIAKGFRTKQAFADALGISNQRLNSYLTGTPVPYPIMLRMMQLWRVDYRYLYHGDTGQLPHTLALALERARIAKAPRDGQGCA